MTDISTQLRHTIALSMVKKIGPVLARYLIAYCGGVEAVFEASKKSLTKVPNIGPATIKRLKDEEAFRKADQQIDFIVKHDIRAYSYLDEGYPSRFKPFETSPIVIYFNGQGELNHHRTVGIVGTRTPSERGSINCQKIVQGLAKYGVQIISGLAYGIDSIAHKYALEENIPTIGMLGHGHDIIYPASNRAIAKKMLADGGTLTEFPIESRVDREHFPMRNRLIASMSDAVIVVESAKKGGSMITADFANQYNKDVFAIPGRLDDQYAQGCNALIKQNKAHLLETAEDIAYIMRWEEADKVKPVQTNLFVELSEIEQKIVNTIKDNPDINIDMLNHIVQLQTSELASHLIHLEFQGIIKALPGKKYILI